MVDRQAVDVHQPVQAVDAGQVLDVDVDPGVGERPVAGDVVLVAVAVDDGVDRHRCAAPLDDGDRRVDEHRLAGAAHEQRVARRVGAVGRPDEHADGRRSAGARRRPSRPPSDGRYRRARPDMCQAAAGDGSVGELGAAERA